MCSHRELVVLRDHTEAAQDGGHVIKIRKSESGKCDLFSFLCTVTSLLGVLFSYNDRKKKVLHFVIIAIFRKRIISQLAC